MSNKTFTLTENETLACEEFKKKHKKCSPNRPFTAMGMQFSYIITPGSIGEDIAIRCNACGEEKSCTDYDIW